MVIWMIVFSLVASLLHWFLSLWVSVLIAFFLFGVAPILLNLIVHRRYSAKEVGKALGGWLAMSLIIYAAISLFDSIRR
jgi:uncharacterized membrane protein